MRDALDPAIQRAFPGGRGGASSARPGLHVPPQTDELLENEVVFDAGWVGDAFQHDHVAKHVD